MNDPRYPIGPFQRRDELTPDERRAMIEDIAATPARLRDAITGLTAAHGRHHVGHITPLRERSGW